MHIPGARFTSATPPPISPNTTGSKNPFRRTASDSSQGSGSVRHSSYGSLQQPTIRSVSDQRSNSPFSEPGDIWETRIASPSFENRSYAAPNRNNNQRMSLNPFLADLSPQDQNPDQTAGLPSANSNVAATADWASSQPSSAPASRTRFRTPQQQENSRPLTYYATEENNKDSEFAMSNRTTNRPRSSSDLQGRDLPSYDDVLQDAPPRTFGNEYGRGDDKDNNERAPPPPRSRRDHSGSSHSSQPRSHSHSQSREERHRSGRKPETPEERRARKEREYEKFKRYQERKDREAAIAAGKKPKVRLSKTGQPLDTIDKLDVTGFGFGSGFHHDGPFDACRPHRNKGANMKAPVAAFPVNGANNALGPAKPSDDQIDAWGRTETEAFSDFSAPHMASSAPKVQRAESNTRFDPTNKADQVHGAASQGLGTSTFLDGAPASQADIEASYHQDKNSGLARKKSLVQRVRKGVTGSDSSAPPRPNDASKGVYRTYSNDSDLKGGKEYYGEKPSSPESNGLLRRVKSLKVRRRS
ncbi:Protein PAL1 [Yarrowia sp. C11]|nr:Protein PAL1 [Yarrowia sp. E02]KAG5372508.1 Protein PAL1 [Yarrowia sp. C11]